MLSLWWLSALACSFVCSIYNGINQVYKMPGLLIMIYRGLLVGVMLLPFVMTHRPVENIWFYVFCIAQGLAIAFNDYRFFRATKAFGAEVSTSLHPLAIGVVFVLWLVITPSQIVYFFEHPLRLLAVVACLSGVTVAILKMCRARAGKKALQYLGPVLFTLAIGDVLNKKAMEYGAENLTSAIIYYMFITGIVCGLCNLWIFLHKRGSEPKTIFKPLNLYHGAVVALAVILLMVFKNSAMYSTPNPAYVSAVILLYPLWIIWANGLYLRWHHSASYPRAGLSSVLLLLASVIGLIFLH